MGLAAPPEAPPLLPCGGVVGGEFPLPSVPAAPPLPAPPPDPPAVPLASEPLDSPPPPPPPAEVIVENIELLP